LENSGYGKGAGHRSYNSLKYNNLREQHKPVRFSPTGRRKRVAAGGIVYHVLTVLPLPQGLVGAPLTGKNPEFLLYILLYI
jgi:hypothetical protein